MQATCATVRAGGGEDSGESRARRQSCGERESMKGAEAIVVTVRGQERAAACGEPVVRCVVYPWWRCVLSALCGVSSPSLRNRKRIYSMHTLMYRKMRNRKRKWGKWTMIVLCGVGRPLGWPRTAVAERELARLRCWDASSLDGRLETRHTCGADRGATAVWMTL